MIENASSQTRTVHVFVLPELADWEIGYLTAAINSPAWKKEPDTFRIRSVGESLEPVRTMGGITIVPDATLNEVDPSTTAMLVLPGSDAWIDGAGDAALEKARMLLNANVPVAAICGATFGLARAGLLDRRRHTSNAPEYLAASGYRGGALYEDRSVMIDWPLITASGTSPLDFTKAILVQLGVYEPSVIDAWYGLYKTQRPEYYAALRQAMQ